MAAPAPEVRVLTRAWVLLCFALMIHVADEALTGFLDVYNRSVVAIHAHHGFWIGPTFSFRMWLSGLIVVCVVLLLLSLWVVRASRTARWASYLFGVLMFLNGTAHLVATFRGQTEEGVTFGGRVMPGTYSAPLLIVGGAYLVYASWKARHVRRGVTLRKATAGFRS